MEKCIISRNFVDFLKLNLSVAIIYKYFNLLYYYCILIFRVQLLNLHHSLLHTLVFIWKPLSWLITRFDPCSNVTSTLMKMRSTYAKFTTNRPFVDRSSGKGVVFHWKLCVYSFVAVSGLLQRQKELIHRVTDTASNYSMWHFHPNSSLSHSFQIIPSAIFPFHY